MIELRPYQIAAIDDLTTEATLNRHRRLLLQAACGAGKTVIAAQIIRHATSNSQRILFLAHRRELVNQCVKKLEDFGVESGKMMAGDIWDQSHPVNVASIQTMHSWCVKRRKHSPPPADLVVIDECHHFNSSKTWIEVVNQYPKALILGMTATPCNKRGKGLGHYFDVMVKCPTIKELIDGKYLVPARYYAPTIPDLEGLKVLAGDYQEDQLATRMDIPKLIGDVVENWKRIAPTRKTMIFATGVKHSIHLTEAFNLIGVKAAHVDGKTPKAERDETIKRFTYGDLQILSNCAVFTEGTDIPAASCLIFARPTKSLLLYLQVAGRVLRPFPGKENAIVIDHSGVYYEHGPIAQDWPWKLDYGKGDVNKEKKKREKKEPKAITCGNCKYIYEGRLECPECGWKPTVKGKPVPTYPAYLQAIDEEEKEAYAKLHPVLDKKTWYLMLLHYSKAKGYKNGWAWMKAQEKFPGERIPWKWQNLPTIEPSMDILQWIKSRQIAWRFSRMNPANKENKNG